MNQLLSHNLYCPFPSQTNKYVDILEDYSLEWVLRFNLLSNESTYKRFCKSKFFLLAASAYPYSNIEELKIAHDWLSWVFIWDDQCDLSDLGKKPEVLKLFHQRFLEILNGAEVTNQDIALTFALSNLRERTLAKGSLTWFNHFISSLEKWLQGCVEEATIRTQGIVPDLDTYMMIRKSSVGVDAFLAITEFCHNLRIPNFLRKDEKILQMQFLTGHIIACCNDIFSASREISNGDVNNLVLVLHKQFKIPLNEAFDRVAEIHNTAVQKMMDLETSIPNFREEADPDAAKFILGMHYWIRSNHDWYSQTGRYQSLEGLELTQN
ncbi:terpene synthase [Nostoc sp. ATCC 53789]|uniref:terpene synthase family protein n=1 Tax=Nostoc sp. ATCC 53789 TaxID=76335 RepID=UPI000DECF3A8|nr:terpene synthase [Nostoc sp. ATCC 53789]QHG17683.1 terpene synthase [Nostoc sp. ATCC 53789]RCJ32217.1 terpene synthase [Nostoc sp. ATCC 53789]